jgi:hypothetical protein
MVYTTWRETFWSGALIVTTKITIKARLKGILQAQALATFACSAAAHGTATRMTNAVLTAKKTYHIGSMTTLVSGVL